MRKKMSLQSKVLLVGCLREALFKPLRPVMEDCQSSQCADVKTWLVVFTCMV